MSAKSVKIFLCLAMFSLSMIFYGCNGKKENVITPVGRPVSSKKVIIPKRIQVEEPKYVYKGNRYRDPFASLEEGGRVASLITQGAPLTVNIESLRLTGIISEAGQKRSAILSDSRGSGGFVVKNGRLLNVDGKMVPGIAGVVKEDKVVLITDNNVIKELKLRE